MADYQQMSEGESDGPAFVTNPPPWREENIRLLRRWYACGDCLGIVQARDTIQLHGDNLNSWGCDTPRLADTAEAALLVDPAGIINGMLLAEEDFDSGELFLPPSMIVVCRQPPDGQKVWEPLVPGTNCAEESGSGSEASQGSQGSEGSEGSEGSGSQCFPVSDGLPRDPTILPNYDPTKGQHLGHTEGCWVWKDDCCEDNACPTDCSACDISTVSSIFADDYSVLSVTGNALSTGETCVWTGDACAGGMDATAAVQIHCVNGEWILTLEYCIDRRPELDGNYWIGHPTKSMGFDPCPQPGSYDFDLEGVGIVTITIAII